MIALTHWPSVLEPRGQRFHSSWETLSRRFEQPRRTLSASLAHASKEVLKEAKRAELSGWAPAVFRDDYRSLDTFEQSSAVVLDLDHDPPALEVIMETFAPLAGFVHSTISHRPDAPRFRVILPTSRPITADEYRSAWTWAAEKIRGVDPAAKDPSHLFYLPAVIKGQPYVMARLHGSPINDLLLWCARRVVSIGARPGGAGGGHGRALVSPPSAPPDVMRRAVLFCDKHATSIEHSQGWPTAFALAGKLVRGFRLSQTDAFEAMREWNSRCEPAWSDAELERIIARADRYSDFEDGFLLNQPLKRTR